MGLPRTRHLCYLRQDHLSVRTPFSNERWDGRATHVQHDYKRVWPLEPVPAPSSIRSTIKKYVGVQEILKPRICFVDCTEQALVEPA